jgi:ribulose-5-phosphate 4-epimerase/fuculose-1-phosphate aldolase
MVEITYQMALSTLQTAGILVGIIYYITIMRNQSRAREAQFLLQFNQVFQDKEAIRDWHDVLAMRFQDYQDFMENYDSKTNMESYLQRSRIWRMLNTFGHILKRGLVDPKTVYDAISGGFIVRLWDNHGPIIREIRKHENAPLHLEGLEYCAEAMRNVEKNKLR